MIVKVKTILLAALVAASFFPTMASAQSPGPALKAGPSRPAQAPRPADIDKNGVLILVRSTLLALDQANKTGNYTVLRDLGAPGFQTNTAARLAEIFAYQRNPKSRPLRRRRLGAAAQHAAANRVDGHDAHVRVFPLRADADSFRAALCAGPGPMEAVRPLGFAGIFGAGGAERRASPERRGAAKRRDRTSPLRPKALTAFGERRPAPRRRDGSPSRRLAEL